MSNCVKCGERLPYTAPKRPRRIYIRQPQVQVVINFDAKRANEALTRRYKLAADELRELYHTEDLWNDRDLMDSYHAEWALLSWHLDAERRKIRQEHGPATGWSERGQSLRISRKNKGPLCVPCELGWPTGDEPESPLRGDPMTREERAERRKMRTRRHRDAQGKVRR